MTIFLILGLLGLAFAVVGLLLDARVQRERIRNRDKILFATRDTLLNDRPVDRDNFLYLMEHLL